MMFQWRPFLAGGLAGLLVAIVGLMLLSSVGRTFVFVAAIYLFSVFIINRKPRGQEGAS